MRVGGRRGAGLLGPFFRPALLAAAVLFSGAAASAGWDPSVGPWDALKSDSWIYMGSGTRMTMHAANATQDYEFGFDQAGGGARGMNALKFSYGGQTTGHLVATGLAGSFAVTNTGDSRTFKDLLILVAIDASSLPADFSFSLGVAGAAPYGFNPTADFAWYDHPDWDTGRPSGYYSLTDPTHEGIAYGFDKGMVTVYAAQNVSLGPNGSTWFDYSFTHLPGTACFSVYGYDASAKTQWIYHTNRAVTDSYGSAVSTFEVAPEPATLVLLAAGVAMAAKIRSRWPSPHVSRLARRVS